MKISFILSLSFIIGFISAYIISKVGFRLGLSDIPCERSSHDRAIPKGGGIGIPLAVGLITFLFLYESYFLVGSALILSVIALINDRTEISVSFRFVLEFIAGLMLVIIYKKGLIHSIYNNYGLIVLMLVVIFITIYIVASTNFFNFMDGINGIAGFEGCISFMFLGIYALSFKNSAEIFLIAFSIVAASAGFLLLNFPKAKVFMGDVGSIFLGFFFAGMVVYLAKDLKEFLLLALFQSTFYIDSIMTIFIRLLKRENVFKAHKNHLYQKLVHCLSWTHSRVTLYFGLTQVFICLLGLGLYRLDVSFLIMFWGFLLLAYWSILVGFKLITVKEYY